MKEKGKKGLFRCLWYQLQDNPSDNINHEQQHNAELHRDELGNQNHEGLVVEEGFTEAFQIKRFVFLEDFLHEPANGAYHCRCQQAYERGVIQDLVSAFAQVAEAFKLQLVRPDQDFEAEEDSSNDDYDEG